MFFTTYVSSESDLEILSETESVQEALIAPTLLSREGTLDRGNTFRLLEAAKKRGKRGVLVWDILMPEVRFDAVVEELSTWTLSEFDAIRVQDPGALFWLEANHPNIPVQYIAEAGNANLAALRRWSNRPESRIERLIISGQVPEDRILHYLETLNTPLEVLGAGPILLFYSPRPLLQEKMSEVLKEQKDLAEDSWLRAYSRSQESHERDFPTIENRHGTFMFLNKDQFLLHRLDNLREAGLHSARIDMRHLTPHSESCTKLLKQIVSQFWRGNSDPKRDWPNPCFAPFFRSNNTTKQFSKLKPQILTERDERCVFKVLSGSKSEYLALWSLKEGTLNQPFSVILPNGNTFDCPKLKFQNLAGQTVEWTAGEELILTKWIPKCCPGALIVDSAGATPA